MVIRWIAALLLLISSGAAFGQSYVPWPASPNTAKVLMLMPRVDGITVPSGYGGFFFVVDSSITSATNACITSNTQIAAVPQWLTPGTVENPAYRDHVNTVTLAFSLNKPIVLSIDGCIFGNIPRVVGIDAYQ